METNNSEEDSLYKEVGNYFLNNEKLHDVEFIVGEEQERIKVVRQLLINQSRAWWSMLSEDSPLVEKGDIHLPDIEPEVFILVLKHSYGGLESLDNLSDETVMKLCYCANKYFMKTLMTKIAARLEPRDVKGVFPALHCLAYYNLQEVEEGILKIIQTYTETIFEHPDFLECDVDSITYICKQESLNCDELTLWKAVVEWAKHKAQGGGGDQLRQWMCQPLQHIRLLSLTKTDFYDHVLPLEILNCQEIANVCKGQVSDVVTLSCSRVVRYLEKTVDIKQNVSTYNSHTISSKTSCSSILVKNRSIMLTSFVVRSLIPYLRFEKAFDLNKMLTDITIKISKVSNIVNTVNSTNNLNEDAVSLELNGFEHNYYELFTIPTLINNKGITLLANSKYKIELSFNADLLCWCNPDCSLGHDFDHGKFYCSWDYINGVGQSFCHIQQFTYRLASG